MVEYRHSLSTALAVGLYRLYRHARPVNLKHLGLTRNQWDNFQKLRYWDLVRKAQRDDGKRIGGVWDITQRGVDFIERRVMVNGSVWTYRGERVRYEDELTSFESIHGPYRTRDEYARDSRAREASGQEDLFVVSA